MEHKKIPVPNAKIKLILLSVILSISFLLYGCTKTFTPVSISGFYFDTFITITFYQDTPDEVQKQCLAICEKYENLFSATKENSDVSRINQAKGGMVTISEDTYHLIQTALLYGDLTDGACDLTIYPVSSLWNFENTDTPGLPSPNEIRQAVNHVNYKNIHLSSDDGYTIRMEDPEAMIDLGFIAKGYIADRLKEYLESEGIENCMINLGGNILAMGHRQDGNVFHIGIEKPFSQNEAVAILDTTDCSVVTSGIYERYFEYDGKLYHHILDSQTGYPVENNLYSVTIIGPSSEICDALSTSCFLLGEEKGLELIEQTEGYEAMFVTNEYEQIYSSGFPHDS